MGIVGYVVKDDAADELMDALDIVSKGGRYLSPSLEELLEKMGHLNVKKDFNLLKSKLTERELEIARMICQGDETKAIASKLFISPVTVRVHTKNILSKMGLKSLSDIVKLRDVLF